MLKRKRVAQSQKRVAALELIPIAETRVIPSIEKLAEYVVSEKWRNEDRRAIVVIREDRGFVYVFGWVRFMNLAIEALELAQQIQRSGLTPELGRQLKDALNIHESTQDPVIRPGEASSTRAAVLNAKSGAKLDLTKLSGVWLPPTEFEAPAIGEGPPQQQQQQQQQQRRQFEDEAFVEPETGGGAAPASFPESDVALPGGWAASYAQRERKRIWESDPSASFAPSRRGGDAPAAASEEAPPVVAKRETLRRTPHMDLSKEDPLLPGDEFEVSVYADETAARRGELSEDFVIDAPADVLEFPVTVHLAATDHFEIKGSQSQEIVIKRNESKSDSVKFSLEVVATPTAVRAGTIVAAFEYNGRPCGKVTRSVAIKPKAAGVMAADTGASPVVADQPTASDVGSEGPRMELYPNADQPDMTITIVNPSNDGRNFDVIVTSPLLETYKKGVKGLWALKDVSSEIVRGYFEEFTKDNLTDKKRLDSLNGAGEELFKSTPEHFRKAFWQIIDDKLPLKSIFVVSQEPFIPWELMIPSRVNKDGEDDTREALGATYAIGRWTCGDNVSPSQRLTVQQSQVIAPDYPGTTPKKLPKAQEEADFVRTKFNGKSISPAAYPVFDAAMQTSTATLLHFVCHGAAQTPVAQQIYLEDGLVSSVQLGGNKAFRTACRKNRPFIFLNACEVGRPQPALVGVGGFAQTFIERGATAVVAPLWSVKDNLAYEVAMKFYQTLYDHPDRSFADIVREIRAKAYDSTAGAEDTYAAYCFYGDPLAHRAA
jgi:CHAT domain